MSVTLSEALDVFPDHSDILSACQINIMHSIRSHQPAKELDMDSVWTVEDILAEANRLQIKKETEPMIRVMNAINRRHAPPTSGQINEAMIEEARQYPVEELLESYGVKVRRGMARCPWHEDSTASMSIFKNRVHCFGCGAKHDTISVVMVMDGVKFPEAVKRLVK